MTTFSHLDGQSALRVVMISPRMISKSNTWCIVIPSSRFKLRKPDLRTV